MALALALIALAGCRQQETDSDRPASSREFPRAYRPVSKAGDTQFSTEVQRDQQGEARTVMDLARITQGMRVADLGAGEGYYTVRLSPRVGATGRVVAEDIDREAMGRLSNRVEKERIANVYAQTGAVDDPKLPTDGTFERIFMVHMYHEVSEPYSFLWRLRPALKPGGKVIVVDLDRATDQHGIPPALLFCEFGAVGFRLVQFVRKPEITGFYAEFEAAGARPEPSALKPCKLDAGGTAAQR